MADGSPIEWLQRPGTKPATWNPIRALDKATGKRGWFCVHVHEGCRFCYAEKRNVNRGDSGGNGHEYKAQNLDKVEILLHEPTLLQPLKWRQPRTIFPCSMTDLFGEWVTDAMLDRIFAVAALCPQHTFIILTKRPDRMRAYLKRKDTAARWVFQACQIAKIKSCYDMASPDTASGWQQDGLPNVWGLVSCSTQEDADAFVPIVLDIPLAIRGVSAEPLLSGIDFTNLSYAGNRLNALAGTCEPHSITFPGLDFIIDGGESGPDARPYDIDASRSIQAQCKTAGVWYFRKQIGARPFEHDPSAWPNSTPHGGYLALTPDGFGRYFVAGLKSKKGGDWSEWPVDLRVREFPEVRT